MNSHTLKDMYLTSLIAAALFVVFLIAVSGFDKGVIYTIELHLLYFPIPFLVSMVILALRWWLAKSVKMEGLVTNIVCGFVLGMIILVVYDFAFGPRGFQNLLFTPFSGPFGALVGGIHWFRMQRKSPDEQSPQSSG